MESFYVTTNDGRRVFVEVHGNPKGEESLLLLNGLSQSTIAWYLLLPKLNPAIRVVLMDFVFQGQSDKHGDYKDFDAHAEDVKQVIDFLHLKQPVIAGLSYGSLVAQHFGVCFPDVPKKLLFLSTFAHKTPYFDLIAQAWGNALQLGGYAHLFDVMLPTILSEYYLNHPLIPIELLKKGRQDLNQDKDALLKLMRATAERPDYRSRLTEIKCPCLVVQGEQDLLLPVPLAQEVHKHLKNSECIVLPQKGHTLNLEAITELVDIFNGCFDKT